MSFTFTVKRNPLEISFEAGSIGEGLSILQDGKNELGKAFAEFSAEAAAESGDQQSNESTPEKATRTRRTKAQIAADEAAEAAKVAAPPLAPAAPPTPPPTATAPAPLPTPGNTTVADDLPLTDPKHPLYRAPAAAAPPPPPLPTAEPAPPALTLAPKVVADLKVRGAGDGGKGVLAWLVGSCTFIKKGATFDEAMAVIQFTDDAKLGPIAKQLGIS